MGFSRRNTGVKLNFLEKAGDLGDLKERGFKKFGRFERAREDEKKPGVRSRRETEGSQEFGGGGSPTVLEVTSYQIPTAPVRRATTHRNSIGSENPRRMIKAK